MKNPVLIEACIDSLAGAKAAIAAGAGRLELCDFRVPDGVTPDFELVRAVAGFSPVPVHVLVRPRGGDFVFRRPELAEMTRTVAELRWIGAHGVAIGALTRGGTIDEPAIRMLQEAARPMGVTFHRAFDLIPNPEAALDGLIRLGVDRVLTAGPARSAEAGIPGLRDLVERAGGRIGIIAAGGIREHNVARIVRETGVREVHSRGDPAALIRALAAG